MATKMKLHHKTVANFKGYSPPLDSNIDSANNDKGDFHEGFEIGWEEIQAKAHDEKRANDGAMAGANVWPSDNCTEFREACLEYYHAAVNVGKVLFPLFALALELPETYFDDKTRNSAAIMRTLHYPLQDGHPEIDDDTPGIGAHTDFECFTILWQQPGILALQVMNSQKRWIDAPAIKDTLVINIGDQLALWTNDVFKSTVHRAMNKSGKERYSIPLFFGTDYHVNIEVCGFFDETKKINKFVFAAHTKLRVCRQASEVWLYYCWRRSFNEFEEKSNLLRSPQTTIYPVLGLPVTGGTRSQPKLDVERGTLFRANIMPPVLVLHLVALKNDVLVQRAAQDQNLASPT
ncbi:hypothetical protein J3R82DRAFT_10124 [Butyriboletus roseoflavus]|nr:hypothetical protein J3R82DRAFT_10124 [Butyriboletus roseoflavus]